MKGRKEMEAKTTIKRRDGKESWLERKSDKGSYGGRDRMDKCQGKGMEGIESSKQETGRKSGPKEKKERLLGRD